MTDRQMKRYRIYVWAWLILTAAAYVNTIIDIIKAIRKLWG